jgi:hypothetical protein
MSCLEQPHPEFFVCLFLCLTSTYIIPYIMTLGICGPLAWPLVDGALLAIPKRSLAPDSR